MSKRIHSLPKIDNVPTSMFLAIDRQESGGSGTYRSTVKNVIGSVIGTNASKFNGGSSIRFDPGDTDELCLSHTLSVPAANTIEGGQVNMYYNDKSYVGLDAFVDTTGGYKNSTGDSLGKNKKYFRVLLPDSNSGEYAALVISAADGVIYKPRSTTDTTVLIPLGSGGTNFDSSDLQQQIDDLKNQLNNATGNTGGRAHVGELPPNTFSQGSMWWDTGTATMYVYDGISWVIANK